MTGACLMRKPRLVGVSVADGIPGPSRCGVFLAWRRPVVRRPGSGRGKVLKRLLP